MNATTRQFIAECGARCERALQLRSAAESAGDLASAAEYSGWAELDSARAFEAAQRASCFEDSPAGKTVFAIALIAVTIVCAIRFAMVISGRVS
jgi:hypothetical protein